MLIGAFIFSLSLWAYSSLNENYYSEIKVPLTVNLPEDRALEVPIEQYLNVKIEGNGWNLFNLNFLKTNAECVINLRSNQLIDSLYQIPRSELLSGINGLTKFEAKDVRPEYLILHTGKISQQEIEINSEIDLVTLPNYIIVGDIEFNPKTVKIRGNDKIIKKIRSWGTESLTIDEIHSDINLTVNLKDTLSGIVKLSTNQVEINAKVQQLAEVTFEDIAIVVKGGKPSGNQYFHPATIDITVRGGVNELQKLTPNKIMAYVLYNELVNDTRGVLKVYVDLPENYTLLRSEPEHVLHFNERKSNYLVNY